MLSTIPTNLIRELSCQRWLIPVLAGFNGQAGARFAELHRRIGLPRDSLARTLDKAGQQGWIMANPGHGHPLRPEWVVTEAGREAVMAAGWLSRCLMALAIPPTALTRWSLPAIKAMHDGADRFNLLLRALEPATPRAISQTLRALEDAGLVLRELEAGRPPSSRYCLTERGQSVAGQRTIAL